MKLHAFPPSPNATKVMACARELGLDCDVEMVDLTKGEQLAEDYLALNPNHMIPTLEDGDFVLWESNAIMQYLCSKKSGQTLYPADARGQADVNRWLFWQLAHWGSAIATVAFERLVKGMLGLGDPDPAKVADGEERFHRFAKVLDSHLQGREFLVGDGFTLADIAVAAPLVLAVPAQLPVADYAEVQRWSSAVLDRPCFKEPTG